MIQFYQLANLLIPVRLVRQIGRKPLPTNCREIWIQTGKDSRVYAHLYCPKSGMYPGVVFVPGAASCGTDYYRAGEMQPKTVAALGFAVLVYDPSGRGKTGGEEDFWGLRQQDELAAVLQWLNSQPGVKKNDIGIVSFSIGITIATGALARHADDLDFVRYLYDWEGPSNRFNITKNDTHPPLLQFPTRNDEFWRDREACQFIGDIKCGYFRYQAINDHMQGQEKEHALELINLAVRGQPCWTLLNHNQPNMTYDSFIDKSCWVSPEADNKAQILRFFLRAAEYGHTLMNGTKQVDHR